MKVKKSIAMLISAIIATVYFIYMIYSVYIVAAIDPLAGVVVGAMTLPHMLFMGLGLIFAWVGFGANKRWGAITAGIMFSVGLLFLLFGNWYWIIPALVLAFVAAAQIKKNLAAVATE